MQTKLKNIVNGRNLEKRFLSSERVEKASLNSKSMQYLYKDSENHIFMDNDTYEQISVPESMMAQEKNFVIGGMNVDILFDNDEILDVRIPAHVVLLVEETEPGFKGNTATGATKPATVETGYVIQVPLFVNIGDKLKIDTRTGQYIERAK